MLTPLVEACASVPGIAAIVLGGSRARGREHAGSDWGLDLLFREDTPFDPGALASAIAHRNWRPAPSWRARPSPS